MKNKNLIRFVQALLILPVMTMSTPISSIHNGELPQNVLAQKLNNTAIGLLAFNQAPDPAVQILKAKGDAIDAYFKEHNMPLVGTGLKMATEAENNGLDWRLVAAIAVRESTGGKFECKKVPNNAFGWGSCKIGFNSNEHAIEIVAKNLGGNNPKTAYHYEDKTTKQILRAYNPPSIVPRYAEQVIDIMEDIGPVDMTTTLALNT
jgi:hypothetical protein